MSVDLSAFGKSLNLCVDRNQPLVAEDLISQVNNAFTQNDLSAFIIDSYFLSIFDSSTGLLNFLKRVIHKSEYKKAKVNSFELLYTIVNNCKDRVQNHLIDIIGACSPVVRSSASAMEKQKSLKLLKLIISTGHLHSNDQINIDVEMEDLYNNTLYKCLHLRFDKADTVQEELLVVVGALTKHFPLAINNPTALRNTLLGQLNSEIHKTDRSLKVIAGAIEAVSNYLENFPFDIRTDKATGDTIYQCCRLLADPGDAHSRVANRESLTLVSKHIVLLASSLYAEAKWWHITLLKWFQLGIEDKKVARQVLEVFYREISTILNEKREDTDRELFKYFMDYFSEVITNGSSKSNQEMQLAICGLGLLARSFTTHITPEEINKIFITIKHMMEHLYILNNKPSEDEIYNLPHYIQTLSHIIRSLPQLRSTHVTSLQQMSVLLIKLFPQISASYHYLIVETFLLTLFQLLQCKDNILEDFLEDVVYQGVIWTCSHQIAIDAELYKDQVNQVTTYKSYLLFWNSVLNATNRFKFEKYEINIQSRNRIVRKFFDVLIKTLFLLINKLNLTTKEKDVEGAATDPAAAFEAVQINDFVIFVNLVDLYQDILEKVQPELLKTWIPFYINQIIVKSYQHPLVSGFYKLLAVCLKVCDGLEYFNESNLSNKDDVNTSHQSVLKFLEEILWKMKQYTGDLQIACLQVIVAAPTSIVKNILPCVAPAFISLFAVGRSYLKLADMGISTLETWLKRLPENELEPLLKEILPSLDSYLQSRSLGGNLTGNPVLKSRKTKLTLSKRKVLVQTEPELLKVQMKILMFLGKLNSNLCMSFVTAGDSVQPVVWNKTLYLKITLPYEGGKLNFYLDQFVPRIVDLALLSSDRKIRVASCELLHSVIIVMLGTSHALDPKILTDLNCLMRTIALPVLKLGCDMDQVVRQLYAPLAFQLMHYYSHPRQMYGPHTQIMIETLLEGITNSSDSALRDFSGSCVKEFVAWTIKQADQNDLVQNPINIKLWIRTLQTFSIHPDPYKRLGAALIFNNIYTILREEVNMLNMFWLEILCAFIANLNYVSGSIPDDNICIDQVLHALNHIQRVLVEKATLFNKQDNIRRKPPGLEGILLKDVVLWLLKQTGSSNTHCRQKSMSMFCKIAPLVNGCNNTIDKFIETYVLHDLDWVVAIYETELIKNPIITDVKIAEGCDVIFRWLNSLVCALDGYNFASVNNLVPKSYSSEKSEMCVALRFFINNIALKNLREILDLMPSGSNIHFTPIEKKLFNNLKSTIVNKLIEFFINTFENTSLGSYLTAAEEFCGDRLWNLLYAYIFEHTTLGFHTTNFENECLILKLLTHIQQNCELVVTNSLVSVLLSCTTNSLLNYNNLELGVVSLKQRQLLKGILLLSKSNLPLKANLAKYITDSITKICTTLTKIENNKAVLIKLHKSTREFWDLKLQLALEHEDEFNALIQFLSKDDIVTDEYQDDVHYQLHFFSVFKDTIINHILSHFSIFINKILAFNVFPSMLKYIIDILKYIHHKPKELEVSIVQQVIQFFVNQWETISVEFDCNETQRQVGIDVIVKLVFIAPKPLYLYTRNNLFIVKWLINQLEYEETGWSEEMSLSFKSEVLKVLPCVIGSGEFCEAELRNSLGLLQSKHFTGCRIANIAHVTTFEKLLKALKISTSNILLEYGVDIYVSSLCDSKDIELYTTLKPFIRNMLPENQVHSLTNMYNMCFNSIRFNHYQRYTIANNVLAILIQNCFYISFEKFYVNVMTNIIQVLKESCANFSAENTTNRSIALILVEMLFLRIKTEGFQNNHCPISKAAYPEDPPSDKKLLKQLTLFTLNILKKNYTVNSAEERQILRCCKCHSYKTLVSLICNTQTEINIYNRCLFSCKDDHDQNILWASILDLDEKHTFNIDFDVLPTMKNMVVNIRSSLHDERKKLNCDTHTVNYIESQHLFNSTLSEDITKYDFTTSILRSQTDEVKERDEPVTKKLKVTLDSVDMNEHECMGTICGLIKHMVETNISALPLEGEDVSLPVWMKLIWDVMLDDSTHSNVRIFLAKVIYNTQDYFKPYAKWFLAPIMKLIVDGCIGNYINYFSVDLVIMLTSWSTIAIPLEDKPLASKLLKFLMENCDHGRRDIFKNNLEQVKLVVEAWKECLDVPYALVLSKIQLEPISQKLDVGIHLAAVLLANNIAPWQPSDIQNFLMLLSKIIFKNTHRNVYGPCSEVIGMALRFMDANNNSAQNRFKEYLHKGLKQLMSNDDKFAYCVQGIVLHYPTIVDNYLLHMIPKLPKIPGSFKCIYLRIFLARIEKLASMNELPSIDFQKLLTNDSFEVQVLTLEIVKECVHHFKDTQLVAILQEISKLATNPFSICRSLVYDGIINTYKVNDGNQNEVAKDITKICKEILLQGFTDDDSTIQEKLFTFWSTSNNVPHDISKCFLYLLSDMYKTNIEEHYMGYSTYLLLNTIKTCEEFDEKLFQYALYDCTFEEYQLISNWRRQHASIVPLFADTLSSQDSSLNVMKGDVLRATASSLEFVPTQTSQANLNQSQSHFYNTRSTLLFSDSATNSNEGVFKDPNVALTNCKSRHGRRFLKDKAKIGRYFANLEVKKSLQMEELRKEKTKQAERNITVYRKYRVGDYPDIEITLSSVINPLQMLARCDANLARSLYKSLFTSLINKQRKDDHDLYELFLQSVSRSLNDIFTTSTQYIPNTIGTFLDIALAYKSKMKFNPEVVSTVCLSSGLLSVGCLLLEDYLISEVDDVSPAKRIRGVEDEYTLHWVKLAELYKAMEEWDVVHGIFLEKMNCGRTVIKAIEAESAGDWKTALDSYSRVITQDVSEERKDYYYESYFKCFAGLAEWGKLSDVIEKSVTGGKNDTWSVLWDDGWNQQKLLPWYITAGLHNILDGTNQKLLPHIQQSLTDSEKLEYLKYNFGEELTMLSVLQNNFDTASHYSNIALTNFLENWSHLSPLFVKLRGQKILNLQNIIDIVLFINIINNLQADQKIDIDALFSSRFDSSCDTLESLMFYETRTVYRNQFIKTLKGKLQSLVGNDGYDYSVCDKSRFRLHVGLAETALEKENYYVARKHLRLTPQNIVKTNIESMQWYLTLSKVTYFVSLHIDNNVEKLPKLLESWKQFQKYSPDEYIRPQDTDLCYVVKIQEQIYKVTQAIYNIISSNPELYNKHFNTIQQYMGNIPLTDAKDVDCFGITSLQNILDRCASAIQTMMNSDNLKVYKCMAQAFIKLAYYSQNIGQENESAFIVSVLRATKLGSPEGRQLFPCLLSLDIGETYRKTFLKEVADIPTWMFLRWIPQLLANLNTPCIFAISDILVQLAKMYPQAMIYPYKLSREKYNFKLDPVGVKGKEISARLDSLLLHDEILDNLLKSMSFVCSPGVMLSYYISKMITACTSHESVQSAADTLFREIYSDTGDLRSSNCLKGKVHKVLAKYESKIKTILKVKFDPSNYQSALSTLREEVGKLTESSSMLKEYSPWLANYQALELQSNIEIPGQYIGDTRPLIQYHTKIMGFSQKVFLQRSLRAPIQVIILGNDAKEYPYLVKFGEDLRQDQRVEQIFGLMNNIMSHDANCNKRQLSLCTYQVIPLTGYLGIIEWIQHTEVLQKFIEDAMDVAERLSYTNTKDEHLSWICKAQPGRQKNINEAYKYACLKYSREATILKYKSFVSNVPNDILRRAFSNISVNSESFFALRQKFIVSYAVICASHWLLGIGDRHLQNSLISICNGQAIGIDFGHAFGTATQFLRIPEMVPFRLTPHILSLLQPFDKEGILQDTMIHCLRAFRKSSDVLLATMNVFIKEPSLDWLDFARKSELTSGTTICQEWYPNTKIAHARRKLQGVNPKTIMIEEIKAGHGYDQQILDAYIKLLQGSEEDNFRAKYGDDLSEELQVKCLLDQATDYNLLGRMYVGWQAWV